MDGSTSTAQQRLRTAGPNPRVRLAFFGSPEFAVPSLQALLTAGLRPALVVTQPQRPAGRGLKDSLTPVHRFATELGIPCLTPRRLTTDPDLAEQLRGLDVAVVAAYGNLIPADLLALPTHGFLNLHPSLLPRYRGATPIPAAIVSGDETTGVSLMVLDAGLDTGPLVAQASLPIPADATTATLTRQLAALAATLLVDSLDAYINGTLSPHPQDDRRATLTKPLTREDGRLMWNASAAQLERQIRAFNPWPGTFTTWHGQTIKILAARCRPDAGPPGQVFPTPPLRVACGQGALELLLVQFPSGRPMSGDAALAGRPLLGARFD